MCGFSTNGLVGTHLISYCVDHGVTEVAAARLLAAMGIFDLIGTTVSGWLTDRFSAADLLFWYYGLRGLSLMVLPFTSSIRSAWAIFAVFYGLDWVATVPPTVALTNEVFGSATHRSFSRGSVRPPAFGAAIAAAGAGVCATRPAATWGLHREPRRLPDRLDARVADRPPACARDRRVVAKANSPRERVVRLHEPLQPLRQDVRVNLRRRDIGVPSSICKLLRSAPRASRCEANECRSTCGDTRAGSNPASSATCFSSSANALPGHRPPPVPPGKQPAARAPPRTVRAPPVPPADSGTIRSLPPFPRISSIAASLANADAATTAVRTPASPWRTEFPAPPARPTARPGAPGRREQRIDLLLRQVFRQRLRQAGRVQQPVGSSARTPSPSRNRWNCRSAESRRAAVRADSPSAPSPAI